MCCVVVFRAWSVFTAVALYLNILIGESIQSSDHYPFSNTPQARCSTHKLSTKLKHRPLERRQFVGLWRPLWKQISATSPRQNLRTDHYKLQRTHHSLESTYPFPTHSNHYQCRTKSFRHWNLSVKLTFISNSSPIKSGTNISQCAQHF